MCAAFDNLFLLSIFLCVLYKFQEQTLNAHNWLDRWIHIRFPDEQTHSLAARLHNLRFKINWHFPLQFPLFGIHHFLPCPLGTCVMDHKRFNASTFDCSFWTLVKYRTSGHFIRMNDGLMKQPHGLTTHWIWGWAEQTSLSTQQEIWLVSAILLQP